MKSEFLCVKFVGEFERSGLHRSGHIDSSWYVTRDTLHVSEYLIELGGVFTGNSYLEISSSGRPSLEFDDLEIYSRKFNGIQFVSEPLREISGFFCSTVCFFQEIDGDTRRISSATASTRKSITHTSLSDSGSETRNNLRRLFTEHILYDDDLIIGSRESLPWFSGHIDIDDILIIRWEKFTLENPCYREQERDYKYCHDEEKYFP